MEGRAPQLSGAAAIRLAVAADVDRLPLIEAAAGERFRTIPELAFVADHDPSFAPEIVAGALADGRLWVAEVSGVVVGVMRRLL